MISGRKRKITPLPTSVRSRSSLAVASFRPESVPKPLGRSASEYDLRLLILDFFERFVRFARTRLPLFVVSRRKRSKDRRLKISVVLNFFFFLEKNARYENSYAFQRGAPKCSKTEFFALQLSSGNVSMTGTGVLDDGLLIGFGSRTRARSSSTGKHDSLSFDYKSAYGRPGRRRAKDRASINFKNLGKKASSPVCQVCNFRTGPPSAGRPVRFRRTREVGLLTRRAPAGVGGGESGGGRYYRRGRALTS